ncbi:asparagine synthase (glutamine-hydrolyzing) [bacterium]|jgi:asparagine synthase (glutamine-hydrolysing)|nr:asparagine synthase (glutamine-hydrolyzing) [bacterium]
MCGISGIITSDKSAQKYKSALYASCRAMKHRGPDEEGFYSDNDILMGHVRLSIIDLETGCQPLFNEDRSVAAVFNGEIYNYIGLKNELKSKGHNFITKSDTEVIVHAYEEYGIDCFNHFNGMFAVAIYDIRKKKLVLARDRLGIKPVYYYQAKDAFVFASEIKGIIEYPFVRKEIDYTAFADYFTYLYVPSPLTMLKNCFKLKPGEVLVYQDGAATKSLYWDVDCRESVFKEKDLMEKVRCCLADAVNLRLISDVPLGAFLSGGIDSSSIVALMRSSGKREVRTFSISFETADKSYKRFNLDALMAKKTADFLGTQHKEFRVYADEAAKDAPSIIQMLDDPLSNPTAIPDYFLCKLASEDVKVCLSGDGGDELFGGYNRYIYDRWIEIAGKNVLLKNAAGIILSLGSKPAAEKFMLKAGALDDPLERYYLWSAAVRGNVRDKMLSPKISDNFFKDADSALNRYLDIRQKSGFRNKMMRADIKTWLPDHALSLVDRMSMANSLEVRVPFLDHRLVELSATINEKHKVSLFRTKHLLRKAFRGMIPDEVISAKKMGFITPASTWLRTVLKDSLTDMINEENGEKGLFNKVFLKNMAECHFSGKGYFLKELWAYYTFKIWSRRYIG